MKTIQLDFVEKAKQAIQACLAKVPYLRFEICDAEENQSAYEPDFAVNLSWQGGGQTLICEAKKNGQPRMAREAVNQLHRLMASYQRPYGVFIAPYISPQSAEICTKDGIGYLDLAGNCRLSFGSVYIEQEGRPNQLVQKRYLRSLYSPRAERVLRVLLTGPKSKWKVQELAKAAQVSLGQVANVKKLLEDREWLRLEKEGFGLRDPESLLKEWAENYRFSRNEIREFYSLRPLAEIEAKIAETCRKKGIRYALTGFSAAARWAPAVRYQKAMAYVVGAIDDVASSLKLKSVPSGANVCLLSPYDEDGVFFGARSKHVARPSLMETLRTAIESREPEGIRIASPVQTYLDLRSLRGRGEEAAAALLEVVIRPSW